MMSLFFSTRSLEKRKKEKREVRVFRIDVTSAQIFHLHIRPRGGEGEREKHAVIRYCNQQAETFAICAAFLRDSKYVAQIEPDGEKRGNK